MSRTIRYIERPPGSFVSLEKAFREIAASLSEKYQTYFDQLPYGLRVFDTLRNLLFFRPEPADVFRITGHVTYIALRCPPERTVLSMMDVRFVNMNQGLRRYVLKKLYLDLPVRRLRYITAISENVRDEILKLTGCPPEKVRVLDLPLFSHFKSVEVKKFDTDYPRILQVGTMVNKNVPRLAAALKGIPCKLIVVGELDEEQVDSLITNSIDYENFSSVTDEAISSLYARSDIVTFCSTYEGFGLPIIEAQAMSKPVVTSDLSPMRETAGNGAVLVDPFDPDRIREGVERVINDREYREQIVSAGLENTKRFESGRVASQYEALYDEVIACSDSRD